MVRIILFYGYIGCLSWGVYLMGCLSNHTSIWLYLQGAATKKALGDHDYV